MAKSSWYESKKWFIVSSVGQKCQENECHVNVTDMTRNGELCSYTISGSIAKISFRKELMLKFSCTDVNEVPMTVFPTITWGVCSDTALYWNYIYHEWPSCFRCCPEGKKDTCLFRKGVSYFDIGLSSCQLYVYEWQHSYYREKYYWITTGNNLNIVRITYYLCR